MKALRFLLAAWFLLGFVAAGTANEVEQVQERKLSDREAIEVGLALVRIHVRHGSDGVDLDLAKRMLRRFAEQLDPSKTSYCSEELDKIMNLDPVKLAQGMTAVMINKDIGYFRKWATEFKEKQLAREAKLIGELRGMRDDVLKKATKEEEEFIRGYPATEADIAKKLLVLSKTSYEYHRTFLSEDEAFEMTMRLMERLLKRKQEMDPAMDVANMCLKAFMLAMDPHSGYMDEKEKREFLDDMASNYSGIGAILRSVPAGAQVVEAFDGFPAALGGVAPNDQIVGVDGNSVFGMELKDIIGRIKGQAGTKVKLTLRRVAPDGEAKIINVELTRAVVQQAALIKSETRDVGGKKIGYISFQSFYQNVHKDFLDKLGKLGKLDGLVVDLRDNGGGSLWEAIRIAGMFISKGPVVAQVGQERGAWLGDPDNDIKYDGPLIVLVNQYSASASEIVAGALRDYGRAIVVGHTQTFGKGSIQTVMDFGAAGLPGMAKITIAMYFTPSGLSTQIRGVTPDIVVPGRELKETDLERAEDGALPEAEVPGVIVGHPDRVKYLAIKERVLPELAKKSEERTRDNPDFDVYKKPHVHGSPDPQREEAYKIAADLAKEWDD